jgi:hypothetical protein
MDIARPDLLRKKKIRLAIYGVAALVTLPAVTIGVSRLKPAAPTVERATVWLDSVRRGEMLREVKGLGTLVPVDIRWIPAQSSARVDRIVLQSGALVKPDSVILELSDPQHFSERVCCIGRVSRALGQNKSLLDYGLDVRTKTYDFQTNVRFFLLTSLLMELLRS